MKDNGMTAQFAGEVERATSGPKPSVGRIVHYTTVRDTFELVEAGQVWPAIITGVEPDGRAWLTIMPPRGVAPYATKVPFACGHGSGKPGTWSFPERV